MSLENAMMPQSVERHGLGTTALDLCIASLSCHRFYKIIDLVPLCGAIKSGQAYLSCCDKTSRIYSDFENLGMI